jgi:hypothetical protein
MTVDDKQEPLSPATIFAKMHEEIHAKVLSDSEQIAAHAEPIRKLEEITRQVDSIYIGSYLSA